MNHSSWTRIVVMALTLTCVACDKIKPPSPELQKPPSPSSQASQPDDERTAFGQTAQKELDELRSVIAEFRTKAATANQQTKARLDTEIEKLEVGLRETQQRLSELKSATAESWTQLKESFGKSREQLKNAIENFRKTPA